MPEVDLVGGAGETVDIDALAEGHSGDPDADAGAETPAADASTGAEGKQPAAESAEDANVEPKQVPYKAYSRLYGENKDKDREIARLRAEAAQRGQPAPHAPVAAAPAAGNESAEVKFLKTSMQPVIQTAVDAALAPIRAKETLNEARENLDSFWEANPEPEFKVHKDALNAIFMTAVKQGNDPKEVNPNLILNALIGDNIRTKHAARRSVSEQSITQQRKVNDAAGGTTAGSRATSQAKPGTSKKYSEKSASEIEQEFGHIVIWKKGLRAEDDE